MRFVILASGSKGNAAIIEHGGFAVLLDCGISLRRMAAAMGGLGLKPADLDTLLVTHEHSDHVSNLDGLVRATGIKPHMTRGTAAALQLSPCDYEPLRADETLTLGEITAMPYTLPHDAREAVQFTFEAGGAKLGFVTDAGQQTVRIRERLSNCNALVMECNYDPTMLENNAAYPRSVKNRITGGHGHLSNNQAAMLLREIAHKSLRHISAVHISENNNREELVITELEWVLRGLRIAPAVIPARQREAGAWVEVC